MEVSTSVRDTFVHLVHDVFPNLTTDEPHIQYRCC